jgi:hypothetical protein
MADTVELHVDMKDRHITFTQKFTVQVQDAHSNYSHLFLLFSSILLNIKQF